MATTVETMRRRLARLAATKPPKRLHPEDRKAWEDGQAEGLRDEDDFACDFERELTRLITTYCDDDAEEMFKLLREHYWSGAWAKARRKRSPRATNVASKEKP